MVDDTKNPSMVPVARGAKPSKSITEGMNVEPFHRRLAELYAKYDGKIYKIPIKEIEEPLKAHYHWAMELSRLEMLAQAAQMVKDEKWLKDICKQIDRHLSNTTGGNVL